MTENLIIIRTLPQFQELFEYIKDKEFIAFDTETTGLLKDSQVIGFSVAAETDKAYYVILAYWDVETKKLVDLDTNSKAAEFISLLVGKQLIMHNSVFDCWKVETAFNVKLMPSVHTDTMLLAHLIDENRRVGLKELATELYGESSKEEMVAMKKSVEDNGGSLSKEQYELYKADSDLLGKYGAKDTILTLKLFYSLVPLLYEQGLEKFFYEEETMPLLRGPTYDLNTTGILVDAVKLQDLRGSLEVEIFDDQAFIRKEIQKYVKDKYPATKAKDTFNINSGQQIAWLLFHVLDERFGTLTDGGKALAEYFGMRIPYSHKGKLEFIQHCKQNEGREIRPKGVNPDTGKKQNAKKVESFWKYCAVDEEVLTPFANKYNWVSRLLEYKKRSKLLSTYVMGIQDKLQYNVIRPSFLQHGTTSGRYSSKVPNFQNLPRDDKRIKACLRSRPGKMFVGADYSQLEPRVFASFSGDERLQNCFSKGEDFYSIIGMEVFNIYDCKPFKEGPDAFGVKYKQYRNISKVVGLASTYGTTSFEMARQIKEATGIEKTREEAQEIINDYFERFPSVHKLMLESHEMAKKDGYVVNLFGRPRRIPEALAIARMFPNIPHEELEYKHRTILNLSINHRIQSTGASIMNRAAIALWNRIRAEGIEDCKMILNVHDEIIVECLIKDSERVSVILRECMENTVELPGVKLEAIPTIASCIADLK